MFMLILVRIQSALKALYKYVVWRKCKKVTRATKRIRIGICLTCPYLGITWDAYGVVHNWPFLNVFHYKCTKCGCFIKLKVWCIDEKCPKDKW